MTMNDFYLAREQVFLSPSDSKRIQRNVARVLVVVLMLSPVLILGAAPVLAGHLVGATFTLTPPTDTNEVGTSHTVTATLMNAGLLAVSGEEVTFVATGTGAENPTTGTATTNSSGQATFTFTSSLPGVSRITATVSDPNMTATASKTWVRAPSTVAVTPPNDTNPVGETHTVTATVRDSSNAPISGTVVQWSVTGTGAEQPKTEADTTDQNGQATFSFRSTATGTSRITATAGVSTTATGSATKVWEAGPVTSIVLMPTTATNTVGDTHTVTATARDAHGNLVSGTALSWSASGTGGESKTSELDTTNQNGQATFTFTSTRPGTTTITASAGTATATATKQWQTGPSSQVTLEPESDTNEVGTSHTVVATIRDQFGNVTTGETRTVTFTASGTGDETPNSATATTVQGRATFTFRSDRTGTSLITATANTAAGQRSDTATKVWVCEPIDGPDFDFDIARDLVMTDDCSGYLLDGYGAVHAFGGATETVAGTLPYFPGFDIAREIVLVFDGTEPSGGYVLDGWGGLHPFAIQGGETPPQAAADKPYFAGNDIARDVVLTGLNQISGRYGGYMLDGRAGVHGFGGNSGLSGGPYFTFDIARELVFFTGEENSGNGYILDGWGGMHPFGDKGPLSGLPYFPGNDIANDALLSSPDSGYMLDGYGGIHPFGDNEIPASTGPYTFGADSYRAFDLPSTRQGLLLDNQGGLWEWFPQ